MARFWTTNLCLGVMLICQFSSAAAEIGTAPIKEMPQVEPSTFDDPKVSEDENENSVESDRPANSSDEITYETANIVPPADGEMVIDLGTALQLAETQNPQIALARELVSEAIGRRKEARAMWLPTLTAGSNYRLHTGVLQTTYGLIRNVNLQSVYVGGGSQAIGSNTVVTPAVRIFAHLGDAYFQPLAAQQMVAARTFGARAVDNLTLLDVADRYFALVAAESRREALGVSLFEIGQIETAQKAFARVGQGRDADSHRARADLLLVKLDEQQAQEQAAIAAVELGRLLQLDPSVRLVTPAGPIELLNFIDESADVEALVNQAFHQRPEVVARSAEIGAAEYQLKNEQIRPWLPQVSAGFSAGAFGGGSNRQDLGTSSLYQGTYGRTDFDVWAIWTVQNLGAGNHAWQGLRKAERDQAVFQRALSVAQIRRDVTERLAQIRAKRRTVAVSWTQLAAAERGAQEEILLTRSGEALPLEALNSVLRLSSARQQLISAVIEYNRAQLRLFVGIGTNLCGLK